MGATCHGGRREAEEHVMLSEVTVHRTMAVCKPFTSLPRPSPCSADVTLQSRSRLLPSGHTILTALCYEGLLDQVHYQLQHCADVNSRNAQHDTPLLVAVKANHTDVAQHLIAASADVNVSDVNGQTPLYVACSHGNEQLVRYLLENGAKVMTPDVKQLTLFGALSSGVLAVVKTLVEVGGACVNVKDQWGNTALIKAAAMGNTELCEYLLEQGVDVSCQTRLGTTALYYALLTNRCSIVDKLLKKTKPSRDITAVSSSPSSRSRSKSTNPFVKQVSLLAVAIHRNCETCVQALLHHDPSLLNAMDGCSKTSLLYALTNAAYDCPPDTHSAGSNGSCRECRHSDHAQVVGDSRLAMVKLLLRQGADIANVFMLCVCGTTFEAGRAAESLTLCLRAMPLHHALARSASSTQVLFRQLALAQRLDDLWTLVVIGYQPDAEDVAVVTNAAVTSRVDSNHSARRLGEVRTRSRTLRNLCVVSLRKAMPPTGNVIYYAHSLVLPDLMRRQITAEHGLAFNDVFCD